MHNFWDKNIELLRQKDQKLCNSVLSFTPSDIGDIIETSTLPTLRFRTPGKKYTYAYDPVDPLSNIEQKLPVLKNKNNLNETVCIFTGMGLGHLPIVAMERRKDIFRAVILEPSMDIFYLALKYVDLSPLFTSPKISIFAGEIDWKQFDETINRKTINTDFLFSDFLALFDWNPELYNNAKNKARAYAVRAVSGMGVLGKFGEHIFRNRMRNLELFREASFADRLKDAFKGKPAVLVSAGPSLDKSIPLLKKAVGKCVMIAVDSALVPLQRNGINPDFVVTLDYRELNSEKLSPDVVSSADFSLVATITSSVPTARRLPLKNLFFCFQDNDTQSWLIEALKIKYLMEPVGTVASLALSFAQMIGADPIIMTGYDFALTTEETDHVGGVVFNHGWHLKDGSFVVKSIDGHGVRTLDFLFEFKQNFEQNLKKYQCEYINATAAGAHIEGTRVESLDNVINNYLREPLDQGQIIKAAMEDSPTPAISSFIAAAKLQIDVANKSLKQIQALQKQNSKVVQAIQKYSKKLKGRVDGINRLSQLTPQVQKDKKKLNQMYKRLKPFMPMEEVAAKKIHEARSFEETEAVSNYIETVLKESRVLELEMEGHQYGVEVFIASVEGLVKFLEMEENILGKEFAGGREGIVGGRNGVAEDKISTVNFGENNEMTALTEHYINERCPIKALSILSCEPEITHFNSNSTLIEIGRGQNGESSKEVNGDSARYHFFNGKYICPAFKF
ncbi:hypothetical protein MTBBW1_2380047 [Desulfamplus magnetovallimortis]|uniref:6-hydroxymethylpterin diphosphokinase MptE-like domain-containing protein n=1 Tax=Desulfamplus magnetovallimortis TaxID=1246637 RepID=A0A1W1HE58_9BACT|nr:6-hydroxymethylpterin diphosphokinase MptE-like protein [Desulfamplus magnetovallimortis]SLM30723.1 hypothetical protein MTBBW1_2380047 [Desulfamplus magnetovallimortis]